MSDNFADKYFKADVCSSAGLRALPIVHFCQNLNEHEPNIVTNLIKFIPGERQSRWIKGRKIRSEKVREK